MSLRAIHAVAFAVTVCLASCSGPGLVMEPRPGQDSDPVRLEVTDVDRGSSKLELTLVIHNNSDRELAVERSAMILDDGVSAVRPRSSRRTKIPPYKSREIDLAYRGVHGSSQLFVLRFASDAFRYEGDTKPVAEVRPVRLIEQPPAGAGGDEAAAQPAR